MEQISIETLDNFQFKTTYDLVPFFEKYVDFVDNQYQDISNFYSGTSSVYPTQAFTSLKKLRRQIKDINEVCVNNANNLSTYDFWILSEQLEDISTTLDTANNASKWLRSSIVSTQGYLQNTQVSYVGKQGQSLEAIEKDILGSSNPEESWVTTALRNNLKEEDYTTDGNYLIKVTYGNGRSINIQSVVDNIDTSKKTYGLDIQRQLEFQNNDLVVLNYDQTLLQSALILANLKQGDNPIVPDMGIDPNFVGSSVAGLSYPTLFRQIAQSFASDDSFDSFAIIDISRSQDAINVRFQVKPKTGDYLDQVVSI